MKKDDETFKTLMKANGWRKPYFMPVHSNEDIYVLNGFTANFRNYYMAVCGQMPVEEAKKLYESIDESLEIRIDGGEHDSPESVPSRNKEFVIYCQELLDSGSSLLEYMNLANLKEKGLLETNPKDFFIETYHIDTWKGFSVFSKFIIDNEIKSTWFD